MYSAIDIKQITKFYGKKSEVGEMLLHLFTPLIGKQPQESPETPSSASIEFEERVGTGLQRR